MVLRREASCFWQPPYEKASRPLFHERYHRYVMWSMECKANHVGCSPYSRGHAVCRQSLHWCAMEWKPQSTIQYTTSNTQEKTQGRIIGLLRCFFLFCKWYASANRIFFSLAKCCHWYPTRFAYSFFCRFTFSYLFLARSCFVLSQLLIHITKEAIKNSRFTPCAGIKICGILALIYYLYACAKSRAGSRQAKCPRGQRCGRR